MIEGNIVNLTCGTSNSKKDQSSPLNTKVIKVNIGISPAERLSKN